MGQILRQVLYKYAEFQTKCAKEGFKNPTVPIIMPTHNLEPYDKSCKICEGGR